MDPTQRKMAKAILDVFKQKDLRAGGFVNFSDFGKALHWEAGHIKHESQRDALAFLVEHGYVTEQNSGIALTEKGQDALTKL